MRALIANHPTMREFLLSSEERGIAYRCVVDAEDIGDDQLDIPLSRTFSITPVVRGAGAVLKIIAGAALVAAGIFFHQPWLAYLGAGIALGGVAQLLTPVPKANSGGSKENSYFDGPANSTAQGQPVPFGYGRLVIGSKVISAGITVEDNSPTPLSRNYYDMGDYA